MKRVPAKPKPDPPYGAELAGYMPLRKEFDVEWENDAEIPLGTMDFKDTDIKKDESAQS